jgi:C4-dicarboxylate-specific signal transduction histidine kinase
LRSGRWLGELEFRHFQTGELIPLLVDWFRIDDARTGRPMNLATVSRDLRIPKKMETDLRHLNDSLERRVLQRTAELGNANERLKTEIAERERADARAQELQLELLHSSRLSAAGQMAGALAHEINQPLTAIANSVNAARRLIANGANGAAGTARETLEEAADQTLRAGQIIARLREFVARGETEMRIENLPTMIREATDFTLVGSGIRSVQVSFSFDPNASAVLANRIQVQQVLVNLMRNASEAMAGCQPRELEVATKLADNAFIEIAVSDRGPGLSTNIAAHLFEPFQSTKRDGMGLGLSICHSIVSAHGGTLRHESNPGGGTIFLFSLRAAPANEATDGP